MGIADELQRLEQFRQAGTLTEAEFTQAKARTLSARDADVVQGPALAKLLEQQLTESRFHNDLARLDREWELERRKYLVRGNYGSWFIPTFSTVLVILLIAIAFCAFWWTTVFVITTAATQLGFREPSFWMIAGTLQVVGIVIASFIIFRALFCLLIAVNYNRAWRKYQRRRHEVVKSEPKSPEPQPVEKAPAK